MKVPDTSRNRAWLGKIRHRLGLAGYPALRLMALAKAARKPPVLGHLPDGSYLSRLDSRDGRHSLAVRIIEAGVAVTGADGSRIADSYRLITTLAGHRRYPAAALVRLYHERWEIESAFLALRHTLLGGRVLRSGDRPGAEQELWALLTLCQLLRMAMVTAVETRPGTDPDRASFTTALEAAREELTAARGICPDGPADLPGVIGRAVLATLLPARRPRYSARKVKCATSRYLTRDDGRPRAVTAITAITVTITTPPLGHPGGRGVPRTFRTADPYRIFIRKDGITWQGNTGNSLLSSARKQPGWSWKRPGRSRMLPASSGFTRRRLVTGYGPTVRSTPVTSRRLQIKPRNLHTQLGEWAKLGFITRTGFAIYALNTPPPNTSTTAPDP